MPSVPTRSSAIPLRSRMSCNGPFTRASRSRIPRAGELAVRPFQHVQTGRVHVGDRACRPRAPAPPAGGGLDRPPHPVAEEAARREEDLLVEAEDDEPGERLESVVTCDVAEAIVLIPRGVAAEPPQHSVCGPEAGQTSATSDASDRDEDPVEHAQEEDADEADGGGGRSRRRRCAEGGAAVRTHERQHGRDHDRCGRAFGRSAKAVAAPGPRARAAR